MPLLQPLEILEAKYTGDGIVLKVKLPNGNPALAYTDGDWLRERDAGGDLPTRMCGRLLAEMPKLTNREIEAVKHGTIFKGMTEDALYDVLGFPKTKNDWGDGGEQLVFTDTFIVYLDSASKVVNWQELNQD